MTTTLGRTSVRYLLLGSATADAGDLLARSVEERGVGATVGAAIDGLKSIIGSTHGARDGHAG